MTRPSSFLVLGNYLNKQNRALWTSYRGLDEAFPWRVNDRIMEATARHAPKQSAEKPPIHFMLNANPDDRHITRDEWETMADRTLQHMGLVGHQAKIVEHPDTFFEGKQRQHIHIMVNAVREDGKAWRVQSKKNPKNWGAGDYKWKSKLDELCREFEKDYGLEQLDTPLTAHREGREWNKARSPNRAEEEINQRTGRTPDIPMSPADVKTIAPQAKDIIASSNSWDEIQKRLSDEIGYSIKAKGPGLILSGEGGQYAKLSSLGKVKLAGQDKAERLSKGRINRAIGETWEDYWKRAENHPEALKRSLKADTYLRDAKVQPTETADVDKPTEETEGAAERPRNPIVRRGGDNKPPSYKRPPEAFEKPSDPYEQQPPEDPRLRMDVPDPVENVPLQEFTLEEASEWKDKLHDRVALARSWEQLEQIGRDHSLKIGGGWAFHDGTHFIRLSNIDGLSLKRRQSLYLETYGEYVFRRSAGKDRTLFDAEQNEKYKIETKERGRDRGRDDEQEI